MPASCANARPRLSRGDVLRQLADDMFRLADVIDAPARLHGIIDSRIAEGERIAIETRRVVRG